MTKIGLQAGFGHSELSFIKKRSSGQTRLIPKSEYPAHRLAADHRPVSAESSDAVETWAPSRRNPEVGTQHTSILMVSVSCSPLDYPRSGTADDREEG